MSNKYIYFDYAATTPLDRRVKKLVSEFTSNNDLLGNPGSQHYFGVKAKEVIEKARAELAGLINSDPSEIIWTSGATESINLVLKGLLLNNKSKKHIITSAIEHKATLNCIGSISNLLSSFSSQNQLEITYLRPDKNGVISLEKIQEAIKENTALISLAHVNNEIGVIQDLESLSKLANKKGILLHMDAAQSLGRVKIDVKKYPVDFLSFSGHKIYALKGVGALYIKKNPRVKLSPLIDGGGQELGLRSGTLATLNIASMGEACRILKNNWDKDRAHVKKKSDYFLDKISNFNNIFINANNATCVPDIISLRLVGLDSEIALKSMPNIALSAGSACSSGGAINHSHVLTNLGLNPAEAQEVIRVSFGRMSELREIDHLVSSIYRCTDKNTTFKLR